MIVSRFQNDFSKNLVLQFDCNNFFSFDCVCLLINRLIVHDFNVATVSTGGNEIVRVIDWSGTALTLYQKFNELFEWNLIVALILFHEYLELLLLILVQAGS